jgi:hypothetical protein
MILESMLAISMMQGAPATKRSTLQFDHNFLNTTRYEVCVDTLPCVELVTTTPTAGVREAPFPAVTPGEHSASVRACNPDICSDNSNVITFKFVAIPDTPGNLRIVIK